MSSWLARHRIEAGLTLRMSAAGLLAFAVGHLFGLVQVYWAVLTAVIVMQSSIGGSLKAVLDRFAGTIGGAAWGAAATLAVPHPDALWTGIALAAALVPLAALTAFRPAYRVAPVTAAIVLLGLSSQGGVVEAALDRVFEIGLGSVVAIGVALVVSPSRAHEMLGLAGRDALKPMAELAGLLFRDVTVPLDGVAVLALHDRTRAAVERAAAAADEAHRERRSYITDAPDCDPIVRNLRRLSHDLILVGRVLSAPLPATVAERLKTPLAAVADALGAILNGIGVALASCSNPPDLRTMKTAFAAFEAEIAALRRDGVARALQADAVERLFGLAFALEQIGRNLDEFVGRVAELAAAR